MILIPDQVAFALAHPITSGDVEISTKHHWIVERDTVACLTVDTFVAERPSWHLSLMRYDRESNKPIKASQWSPTLLRTMLALRDKLMRDVGTGDWVTEPGGLSMHWRRPLRIDEVSQLAVPVPEGPTTLLH